MAGVLVRCAVHTGRGGGDRRECVSLWKTLCGLWKTSGWVPVENSEQPVENSVSG